jgi:putative lipoic acid-binding regulatory protein
MSGESPLEFPCELCIKVVGPAAGDFEAHAISVVAAHVESVRADASRARASKGGKYSAVTLNVELASRERMDAMYAALKADDRILWSM